MNRDLITNIDPKLGARGLMTVLTAMQDLTQEAQVIAVCAAFKLILEDRNLKPQDAMAISSRAMTVDGVWIPEYRAAQMYVESEL